jgi:5-methylcytosine-specific restriction endonuclease McrA
VNAGRPADPRRALYIARLGLKSDPKSIKDLLPTKMLDRLDRCRDDDFRKVLFGVKEEMIEYREFVFPKGRTRLKGKALVHLREQCLDRDGYKCCICGKRVSWKSGHMAHIKSRGAGGEDVIENVRTLCAEDHMKEHAGKL